MGEMPFDFSSGVVDLREFDLEQIRSQLDSALADTAERLIEEAALSQVAAGFQSSL